MKPVRRSAAERVPLPDLCSLSGLFALVLVVALTVVVMQLAPGERPDWRGLSLGMLFAIWLSILLATVICKLRAWLERLPRTLPYLAAWILMALMAAVVSLLVAWIDHSLRMQLVQQTSLRFTLTNTLLVLLIGAALLRYFYVLAQWRARLAAVARAQVQALQARIRPHFLFNSMNTVAALVRVDPGAAERTIEDLADLFRAALASDTAGTLGEELELIERYLAIEQLRLGERLRIQRDIGELPLDLELPRLLLQPLIENAIRHGIQPRRQGGVIHLHARCEKGQLYIRVGNPLPSATAVELDEDGHGHGLESVRQRIAYHYGERGHLHVDAHDDRYVVEVSVPGEGA